MAADVLAQFERQRLTRTEVPVADGAGETRPGVPEPPTNHYGATSATESRH